MEYAVIAKSQDTWQQIAGRKREIKAETTLINVKNIRGYNIIVRKVMVITKQGDIPCQICDKNGNTSKSGRITDVAETTIVHSTTSALQRW
jgi:hypothetical protein